MATETSAIDRFKLAVNRGDAIELRRVLSESAEARAAINEPLFGFNSPALVAVAGDGNVDIVDTLLEFGADPNRKSSWWAGGFHPLHAASGDVSDRLIASGAVPDACAAARLGRTDLLERILDEDPGRVHERGGDGQTPLHFARSRDVVDLLLARGADPDARDLDHRSSPAEWMIGDVIVPEDSRLDLARYLVERGATADIFLAAALGLPDKAREILQRDPSALALRTSQGDYDEKSPSSYHIYQWTLSPNLSPMQVAARRGQDSTVDVMRQYASPAELLLLACHLGQREEARALVAKHAGLVAEMKDQHRAVADEAWASNAPAVALLMELGFDPSVPGPQRATALHCAAWEGSVECVMAILTYPAGRALIDVKEPSYGGTPLSWCSHGSVNCGNPKADHASVARLLIAAGSQVTQDMRDWGSPGFQSSIAEALESR
jgi:hypothetical protein